MSQQFELYLTCPKSLEGLLLEEARGLGLEEAREQVAAVRGAINGLMSELLEGHIREHLMNPLASEQERNADMEQIVAVVRSYMK